MRMILAVPAEPGRSAPGHDPDFPRIIDVTSADDHPEPPTH